MALTLTYPQGYALVAGGTGTVGGGVVRQLARAGVAVIFTYHTNATAAVALEEELNNQGLRVCGRALDLEDVAAIDSLLAFGETWGGRLHTLAIAAGAPIIFKGMAEMEIAEVESFMARDALAYYKLIHRGIPRLRAGGGGSITVTTTIASYRVIAYDGISPFSKGAVEALIRQLAAEEASHGIRCNSVPIGWITDRSPGDWNNDLAALPSPVKERLGTLVDQLRDIIRLGRAGTPEEAGNLFAFLASDQAAFITGQHIAIDGGATL